MPASRILRGIILALAFGLVVGARPASSQTSDAPIVHEHLVGRGSHLIDLNMGYGRWLEPNAPDGNFGFGVGFLHFPSDNTALGIDVTADGLGKMVLSNGEDAHLELISLLAQGLIHPAESVVTPYFGAGVGPYVLRASTTENGETETNWGVMGRAGLRMVGWRPMLGLDFRYHWIFMDPNSPISPHPGEHVTNALSAKLTLSFLF